MTIILLECCVTPAGVKLYKIYIYVCRSQNTEMLKGVQGNKASLKRIQRTITIQGLTLSTITAAENSL